MIVLDECPALPAAQRSIEFESAGPVETFVRVTLPIIWPGIVAGALLAFALSIDDFVITNFVAGQTLTFPLWVFGAVKVGIPPQVFVMGTAIFAVGVISWVDGRRSVTRAVGNARSMLAPIRLREGCYAGGDRGWSGIRDR